MTTETALKFGPEWLRALSHGNNAVASPPPSPGLPKYKLAEFRYGREEMLALFDKNIKIPEDLAPTEGLTIDKCQLPVALTPITEEEQRTWARSVNSDAVLRLMGRGSERGGGSATATRGGRGGSTERGRGRGRGSYYQRGLSNDDGSEGPPGGFSRPRPFDRSQSVHERSQSWEDKDSRFDSKGYPETGRSFDTTWRRERENEEDGKWRTATSRSEKWGDQLPEWSTDDSEDVGFVGTFDSSGAFLETKVPCTDTHVSGNENDGPTKRLVERKFDVEDNARTSPKEKPPAPVVRNESESIAKHMTNDHTKLVPVPDHRTPDSLKNSELVNVSPVQPATAITNTAPSPSPLVVNASNGPVTEVTRKIVMPTPLPASVTQKLQQHQQQLQQQLQQQQLQQVQQQQLQQQQAQQRQLQQQQLQQQQLQQQLQQQMQQQQHLQQQQVQQHLLQQLQHQPQATHPQPPKLSSPLVEKEQKVPPNLPSGFNIDALTAKRNQEVEKGEDVNFDHLEKAAEKLVAKWTAEEDEKAAQTVQGTAVPVHHEDAFKWFYRDPQGQVQGPFTAHEMAEWFSAGYFTMNLSVRRGCDDRFAQLGELIKRWGREPFLPGPNPPPLVNNPLAQPQALSPEVPPQPPQLPDQEQRLFLLQQQLMQHQLVQQQLLQQQMFFRQQAQLQQIISSLKDQDGFNNLNLEQQHQVILQNIIARQLQQLPARPPGQEAVLPDLLQHFQRLPSVNLAQMKDDVAASWPGNSKPTNSVWDIDNAQNLANDTMAVMQELERKRKEDEERQAEEEKQRQLEQRRRQEEEEEWKRQEELKREETLRRQKEEELRRQKEEEEEQRRQEELRKQAERELMLEEQRRQEEERRRKEQQRIEEQKRKEEEMKRKEEENQKREEKRKLEEEQRKREQEMERQKEAERLRELQRQQEAQRQQEIQRQLEIQKELQRQQQEALQKLHEKQKAEKAKAQMPAWGVQPAPQTTGTLSLSEIQKLQEEKERQEREEQRRVLQAQQQAAIQQQLAQQQANKLNSSLTWAQKPAPTSTNSVKSLLEIQKEEVAELAKKTKSQPPQQKPQNSISLLTAGVWGNASNHLSWNHTTGASGWDIDMVSGSSGGFWDEAMNTSNSRKSSSSRNDKVRNAHVSNSAPNKPKNSRTKKEEDCVMKIFESRSQTADELTQWCTKALSALQSSVDIPTFVAFLKDVESSFEVQEYVRCYLGESKEAQDFAEQFLEKRSRHRKPAKQPEEANMWGPAPAVNPNISKAPPLQNSDNDGQKSGCKKKKKNRMQKIDSSILGFTVHASIDRINVGEIEHAEGM